MRTLGPSLAHKEGGLLDPTSVGEGNETFFIRVWKPHPSRRVLKTLRGSLKGKSQIGQYLLVVDLGSCKWYKSQTLDGVPTKTLAPNGMDY